MRILAVGHTYKSCQTDVDRKISRGWKAISDIKLDESYIGGRYVCVMEKPDAPNSNKSRQFNKYIGY